MIIQNLSNEIGLTALNRGLFLLTAVLYWTTVLFSQNVITERLKLYTTWVATLEIEIGWIRLNSFEKNFNVQRERFVKGEGAISLVTIELFLSAKNLENI